MECRFAEEEIEDGGAVCLNDKEEDFLGRNPEQGWTKHSIGWVGPYPCLDQV